MHLKPKHKRLLFVLLGLASISLGTYIILNNFKDNLVYFYAPKDLVEMKEKDPARFDRLVSRPIRVGGMVEAYKKTSDLNYEIIITDYYDKIIIRYSGLLPPMFREKQGIVAQGNLLSDDGKTIIFQAKELITKHDEKYMPPEVARSLKKAKSPSKTDK